jgi:hypothetical protein
MDFEAAGHTTRSELQRPSIVRAAQRPKRSQGGQEMYQAIGRLSPNAVSSSGLIAPAVAGCDDETHLAATLRTTNGGADAKVRSRSSTSVVARPAARVGADAEARSAVAEMIRAIERRLPGRIRRLRVDLEDDQFILRGISSSYYVKQVAGHLAMTAMDAHLLGRMVNEIEVNAAR